MRLVVPHSGDDGCGLRSSWGLFFTLLLLPLLVLLLLMMLSLWFRCCCCFVLLFVVVVFIAVAIVTINVELTQTMASILWALASPQVTRLENLEEHVTSSLSALEGVPSRMKLLLTR